MPASAWMLFPRTKPPINTLVVVYVLTSEKKVAFARIDKDGKFHEFLGGMKDSPGELKDVTHWTALPE
jgi:hypothetical protein